MAFDIIMQYVRNTESEFKDVNIGSIFCKELKFRPAGQYASVDLHYKGQCMIWESAGYHLVYFFKGLFKLFTMKMLIRK